MKNYLFYVKISCIIIFTLFSLCAFAQNKNTQKDIGTSDTKSGDIAAGESRSTRSGGDTYWKALMPISDDKASTVAKPYNVDLSTGKANVQCPILTVGTPNIQIPIALNNVAKGYIPGTIPTWVGLGWNLSCGGKITRILNDSPDDHDDLTIYTNVVAWSSSNLEARIDADTQPDMYSFEIPGKGGLFVMDKSGKAHTIPYQNIKINYDKVNDIFEIIDDKGTKYTFDVRASKTIVSGSSSNPYNYTYVPEWNLTKIKTLSGENVELTYTGEGHSSYYTSNNIFDFGIVNNTMFGNDPPIGMGFNTYLRNTPLVSEITWDNGKVVFSSSGGRKDFTSKRKLDSITVYSIDNQYLKTYDFTYSSFNNNSLKLEMIMERSHSDEILFRRFEYFTNIDLPSRHSYAYDHWGFFNGKNNKKGIPNFKWQNFPVTTHLDDRTPSLLHTIQGSLKKVWISSSAYTEFEYELNTSKTMPVVGGLRVKSIKTKSSELDNIQKVEYEYVDANNKSTGVLFNNIDYCYARAYDNYSVRHTVRSRSIRPLFDYNGSNVAYNQVKEKFSNGSSNTYKYTTKEDYPDVKCKTYDIYNHQKIDTTYLLNLNKDFAPVTTMFWKRGLLKELVSRNNLGSITKSEQYEYNTNAQKKGEVLGAFPYLNFANRDLVGLRTNFLSIYKFVSQPIFLSKKTVSGIEIPTTVSNYTFDETYLQLKEQTVTTAGDTYKTTIKYPFDYPLNSNATGNATTLMREYNVSSSPIEKVSYKNGNIIGGELFIYRKTDHGSSPVLGEIKELAVTSNTPQNSHTSSYFNSSGIFIFDSDYVTKISYTYYNTDGQLACYKDSDGNSKSIHYEHSLPVAFVDNSVLHNQNGSNSAYSSFEDYGGFSLEGAKTGSKVKLGKITIGLSHLLPGVYTFSFWEIVPNIGWKLNERQITRTNAQNQSISIGAMISFIDEVRVYPVNSKMNTRTYLPGVGITSETDENGMTTYYEYDGFGRQTRILDNDRNVVKEYEYFIRN